MELLLYSADVRAAGLSSRLKKPGLCSIISLKTIIEQRGRTLEYSAIRHNFEKHGFTTQLFSTKEEAMRREAAIKKLTRKDKLKLMGEIV